MALGQSSTGFSATATVSSQVKLVGTEAASVNPYHRGVTHPWIHVPRHACVIISLARRTKTSFRHHFLLGIYLDNSRSKPTPFLKLRETTSAAALKEFTDIELVSL